MRATAAGASLIVIFNAFSKHTHYLSIRFLVMAIFHPVASLFHRQIVFFPILAIVQRSRHLAASGIPS
jgi:hypothetical protein